MFQVWDITIPANTPESAPIKQQLLLDYGTIKKIEIKFPAGCHGMVGVRLFRWGFQLVPLTGDEWVTGDDETVPTETYYEMLETPIFLDFKGCSPNTSYAHTVTVRIQIEPLIQESDLQVIEKLQKIVEALGVDEQ